MCFILLDNVCYIYDQRCIVFFQFRSVQFGRKVYDTKNVSISHSKCMTLYFYEYQLLCSFEMHKF